jgi:uncharacterized protein (DUF2147 family)
MPPYLNHGWPVRLLAGVGTNARPCGTPIARPESESRHSQRHAGQCHSRRWKSLMCCSIAFLTSPRTVSLRNVFGCAALCAMVLLPLSAHAASAESKGDLHQAVGSWQRSDGDVRAKMSSCGNAMCITNTWVRNPGEEKAGDYLVLKVQSEGGGAFSGSAYDPQRKQSYNVKMNVSPDNMTTSGCVLGGLLCKSVGWTRIH